MSREDRALTEYMLQEVLDKYRRIWGERAEEKLKEDLEKIRLEEGVSGKEALIRLYERVTGFRGVILRPLQKVYEGKNWKIYLIVASQSLRELGDFLEELTERGEEPVFLIPNYTSMPDGRIVVTNFLVFTRKLSTCEKR